MTKETVGAATSALDGVRRRASQGVAVACGMQASDGLWYDETVTLLRSVMRLGPLVAVSALVLGAVLFGCIEEYAGPGAQAGSPFTDEDAGTGYELDLAGEDFAGMVLAGKYHPVGWKEPASHGLQMKWQVQDCRTCHGQDLTGGV